MASRAAVVSAKEKALKYIKDIIYIALFLIAVGSSIVGWARSGQKDSIEAQALKSAVENNTEVMNELKDELKNINTFLMDQNELNGQFKEFMENEKRSGK